MIGSAVVDFLFIVTPIVGVCNCSMFYFMSILLMGKRELVALLNLSSWCLVMVEQLSGSSSRCQGAQWHSGRVLDSRPRGRGYEPHRRYCVVSLNKNINPSLVLVQPRKTRPFITEKLLMGRKESNQTKNLAVPWLCLQFVIVVFPDHTHLF